MMPAPYIDNRTAEEIARQVRDLIKIYAPAWSQYIPETENQPEKATGISAALIGVFARYSELIIDRLNQVPQKNFLAFLDLLGASRLPPQPARVPLTFFLAAGSSVDGVVQAGTQAAAPPAEGEKDPVIFETERKLIVTAARLESILVRDPEQDRYSDNGAIAAAPSATGALVFQGDRRIEHIFYIGQSKLLGFPVIENLTLTFSLIPRLQDARTLRWEFWDGAQWQDRTPFITDQTNNLQQSGTVEFGAMTAIPLSTVNGIENRWLRCRLLTPITKSADAQSGMERSSQLPSVEALSMRVELDRAGLAGEAAFTNLVPVDLTKDFFPFGEKPRFGDTLALAQREALSTAGARITLAVTLTNPASSGTGTPPPTRASNDLRLIWEVWNGSVWTRMGTSAPTGPQAPITNGFTDTTGALTRSGQVSFTLPPQVAAATVNGVENFWVRVRIIAGNYGTEARYEPIDPLNPSEGYNFFPATFAPPSISSVRVNYSLIDTESPDGILTFNDFLYRDVTNFEDTPDKSFAPFRATDDARPTFYLGFTLPPDRATFPNNTISLYSRILDLRYGERTVPVSPDRSKEIGAAASVATHRFLVTNASQAPAQFALSAFGSRWATALTPPDTFALAAGEARSVELSVTIPPDAPPGASDRGFLRLLISTEPDFEYSAAFVTIAEPEASAGERLQLVWEYWNGREWSVLTVRDDTENFDRPGLIEFLAPADFTPRVEFGRPPRYWLRVRKEKGEYTRAPRLRRMLLNTTIAAQIVTIANEVLGSSDGSANQKFRATQRPILFGQRLEVREPEVPSAAELEAITREEGADAIPFILDAAGRPREIWVRWHEVPDFHGSSARDRHYVLDHLTGEIRTGNGVNGLIPPAGIGNIRLSRYQIGGGSRGNRPAGSIVQLKTTVPYVDKVTNTEASAGGADAETVDSLLERAPRTIRHRDRAVTVEDYEDLAMLASPEVARAKCVPLRNLIDDPLDERPPVRGEVSVIIVPRSGEAKPQPSLELLSRVEDYLTSHSLPTARVSVVGPIYVRVEVAAEIALTSLEGASAVEQAVKLKLSGFLHPLTGGFEGIGWDFGRKPHRSDVYALIETVPGVDHIRSLEITETEDEPGVTATGRFLVFSDAHRISLVFEES